MDAPTRPPRLAALTLAASLLVALGLGGLPAAAQQSHAVDVRDNSFAPASATITEGDTVVWSQSGQLPHSVTADDGSFDSHPGCTQAGVGCMQQGDTFQRTFDTPGEIAYYCKVHGGPGGVGMAGVVTVVAQPDPDPDPTPTSTPAAEDVDDPAPTATVEEEAAAVAEEDALPRTGVGLPLWLLAVVLLGVGAGAMRAARSGRR